MQTWWDDGAMRGGRKIGQHARTRGMVCCTGEQLASWSLSAGRRGRRAWQAEKKHACLALGKREEKARRLGWLATGLKLEHCSRDVQASHKGKGSSQASRGRGTLLGYRWASFWASFAMQWAILDLQKGISIGPKLGLWALSPTTKKN